MASSKDYLQFVLEQLSEFMRTQSSRWSHGCSIKHRCSATILIVSSYTVLPRFIRLGLHHSKVLHCPVIMENRHTNRH